MHEKGVGTSFGIFYEILSSELCIVHITQFPCSFCAIIIHFDQDFRNAIMQYFIFQFKG